MTVELVRRALALVLVSTTATAFALPPDGASVASTFSGRVFEADGLTARSGAVVNLVAATGEPHFRSQPTRPDGAFVIEGASAGPYDLLVETPEGGYLLTQAVELRSGANPPVALALRARANAQQDPPPPTMSGAETGPPVWLKAVIAGAIGLTALFVINEVSDSGDGEPPASPE